jgi:hypothetical protein
VARKEILEQVEQNFGLVPDFMADMPESVLEQYWTTLNWVMRTAHSQPATRLWSPLGQLQLSTVGTECPSTQRSLR